MTKNTDWPEPRTGTLHLDGWAGRTRQPVKVVGETARSYRIECLYLRHVKLPGRGRWLKPGDRALVSKRGITFDGDDA